MMKRLQRLRRRPKPLDKTLDLVNGFYAQGIAKILKIPRTRKVMVLLETTARELQAAVFYAANSSKDPLFPNIEVRNPNSDDDNELWPIASLVKGFILLVYAQLIDKSIETSFGINFSWKTKVNDIINECRRMGSLKFKPLPEELKDLTLDELFAHLNSLPGIDEFMLAHNGSCNLTEEEFLDRVSDICSEKLKNKKKTQDEIHYANTGYILAAILLCEILKDSFEAIINQHVLAPLGMKNTIVGRDLNLEEVKRLVSGFYFDSKRKEHKVPSQLYNGTVATKFLAAFSTGKDIAKFYSALMHAEEQRKGAEDVEAQTEDAEVQTEDAEAQTEDAEAQTEDTEAQTEDAEAQTEDTEAQTEDAEAQTEDAEAQTEDVGPITSNITESLLYPDLGGYTCSLLGTRIAMENSVSVKQSLNRLLLPAVDTGKTYQRKEGGAVIAFRASGYVPGYSSTAYFVPDVPGYFIVLCNSSGPLDVADHIIHFIVQEYLDLEGKEAIHKVTQRNYRKAKARLRKLETNRAKQPGKGKNLGNVSGVYKHKSSRQEITIYVDGWMNIGRKIKSGRLQLVRQSNAKLKIVETVEVPFYIETWSVWKKTLLHLETDTNGNPLRLVHYIDGEKRTFEKV